MVRIGQSTNSVWRSVASSHGKCPLVVDHDVIYLVVAASVLFELDQCEFIVVQSFLTHIVFPLILLPTRKYYRCDSGGGLNRVGWTVV